MSNIRFKGIMPALITPYDEKQKVKEKTVRALMDWHISQGVDGFYICGSTGEGPALKKETRMEMAEIAVDQAKGRSVIINHIGAPNILDALELTEHASTIGVDCIASLAPTYSFKYTEDELFDYYKRISDYTSTPVMVYATAAMGVSNFPRLMERLIQIPNIIGVKFTIRDYFELRKAKEVNGGDINLINGPDETLICGLAMGADGGIGTTYNLMPDWYVGLYNAFIAGDTKIALGFQSKCNRVTEALIRFSKNGAIKGVKAALQLKGFDVGDAVFPSHHYLHDELSVFKKDLESLGIIF
ncbi:MAG: dihydrodipicolinate synthase family protein [Sphaerochaetaceae bacterium]|nr:dihydrodipicolinate synthase family protein [Sphaerochaetaceae bacterium]